MKNLSIIALLFSFFCNSLNAQNNSHSIGEINNLTELRNIIQQLNNLYQDKEVLYVFDIDNTLLVTNNNGFGSDKWKKMPKDILM